jgi:hypothetical protein
MKPMRLVLLTFGDRLDVHAQAAFCIVSFLKADATLPVSIVTDRPAYYAHFGSRVGLHEVNAATLREWEGPPAFFWRIKIRALQEVAAACVGDDLLYVDADTILTGDLERLRTTLAEGRTLMHLPEHRLCDAPTKTERQNWQVLRNKTFGGIAVDEQTTMWNAGVVGVPAARARQLLAQTLAACDAMCATPARRRLLEQLAFSIALGQGASLADARREVLHYWGNKAGWQAAIDAFWLRSRFEARDLARDIAAFDPAEHVTRPIEVRAARWARWLRGMLDAQPPKRTRRFPI